MKKECDFLKDYIWKNGFEKLSSNPFSVYEDMVYEGKISTRTARLILVSLMCGAHEKAREGKSVDVIVEYLQKECSLTRKMARNLAVMLGALFDEANTNEWSDAERRGFGAFCESIWTIEWSGRCDWHAKHNVSYPCYAKAVLEFEVADAGLLEKHLEKELKNNPFLTEDDVYMILMQQIKDGLDGDMQDFCDADDYYEPYFEEFVGEGTYESEKKWKSWGLDIVSFEGNGEVDFEPW